MSVKHVKQLSHRTMMRVAFSNQAGATLMETMIALALSVVVTTAMVVLMGNSMGTSNRITQMTQLTDELRNVMSMLTRDVRRANYSSTAIFCYGNPSCSVHDWTRQYAVDESPEDGDLEVVEDPVDGCLIFRLDRVRLVDGERIADGNATNDSKGGFRRAVNGDGVGFIEMWVGEDNNDDSTPHCDDPPDQDNDGWLAVTDPNIVDIVGLRVNETALSAEKAILQGSGTTSFTQRQRQLLLAVEGELILEQRMGWNRDDNPIMVRRRVEDMIVVRNDYIYPPTAVAP